MKFLFPILYFWGLNDQLLLFEDKICWLEKALYKVHVRYSSGTGQMFFEIISVILTCSLVNQISKVDGD